MFTITKPYLGTNSVAFDPKKFLQNSHLKNNWTFKPFSGGANYYPGRFLARLEILYFVSSLINRYYIELAAAHPVDGSTMKRQPIPNLDESTPALGANGPVRGDDVYLTL